VPPRQHPRSTSPLYVALAYAIVAGTWIMLSDRALASNSPDIAWTTWVQTIKGWGFVLLTAISLYTLVRRQDHLRYRVEEAEHGASELLGAFIGSAPIAIVGLDRQERILLWNAAAKKLFGWSEEEVLGREIPFVPAEVREEGRRLTDLALGGERLDGIELVRQRKDGTAIAVAVWTAPLRVASGEIYGTVVAFHDMSGIRAAQAEIRIAYDATLEGWSSALDLRDEETEGHARRVTEACLRLARALGIAEEQLVHMRRGALLHDIGKMGIPDSILRKPGPLTAEEWAVMRRHPVYAYELLAPIEFLHPALDIPYCHHERWDGTGYPRGLKGEEIPIAARIFAVVDVWDALRSDRPYRPSMPHDEVLDYIESRAGAHFDPEIVRVFLRLERELRRTELGKRAPKIDPV
jgi:PAS domain S-box-containing protein